MEEWRDISGYEGLYQVSNLGRVKSLDRGIVRNNGAKQTFKGKVLSPGPTNGYFTVCLSDHNKNRSSYFVHRLVAAAFVPNTNNLREVNHINSDRSDSRSENLEWVSTRDNALHGHLSKNKSSKYPGVSWSVRNKKWHVCIQLGGSNKSLGNFDDEEEARVIYLRALTENNIDSKYAKVV